ncbi:uncharacterized protein LOC132050676 [Lycium ferocissimum]|uniref:uncharacterized protein LOC132050676 n=1 Tax=Lycium ferocissimum TaxID=112874 RepID=UPI0028156365|nr:uncharacterized protein LOC132050676 [Lycium ferocissimum]XP_059298031.1 uncharacterized protein LOC132050676 [Lycium ferocissimum]XP_059298032.1 uncharacterized protein LOC132050676 [Lycium ferocissimum]XP_059298033.1 uncharacterized protein LOC132050676 [Lycium ferocissimum]
MADQSSNFPSPNSTHNHTNKPNSPFLGPPRIFNGLLTRSLSDTEAIRSISQFQTSRGRVYDTNTVISPNSILDGHGMQNYNLRNPFGYARKSKIPITKKPPNNKSELETIKTKTKNMPRSQASRVYDAESISSPNSILDGMQNCDLGNPFGYDKKSPNPISKKPPNDKLESKAIKTTPQFRTSRGRLYDVESVTSPNSIHDGMQNLNLRNPFGYDRKPPNPITKSPSNNKLESESIGLALIDPIENSEKFPVLFGAKLKVEIPSSIEVKNTCGDFGEMESSEDYTCVTTHGPNPRTTHIFDNCIVESCCGVRKLSELMKENTCNSCKVDHTEGKDI